MKSSSYWINHFTSNLKNQRVVWELSPVLTEKELSTILYSLQAWQLGETSDGRHLLRAAALHAGKINDPEYLEAVALFIKEEQKHGNNLGRYLDRVGKPRLKSDWGDTLFRKVRYFNTSMEIWTLAVIVVESAAQIFYQALKNATGCTLLKQICTDILIDEAYHIEFQYERLQIIFQSRSFPWRFIHGNFYKFFFFAVAPIVWFGHRKLFTAGGYGFRKYMFVMNRKYEKTIRRIVHAEPAAPVLDGN